MSSGCTSNDCITTLLNETRTGNNIYFASFTLLIFENILTIHLEIEHIWPSGLTIVTVLYYIARYGVWIEFVLDTITQFSDLSVVQCRVLFWLKNATFNTLTWASEALVGLTVWAIWQKDPRLTILMPTTFVALCVVSFTYLCIWVSSVKLSNPPIPHMPGCFVASASNALNKTIIMAMTWIALMFALITISAVRSYKGGSNSSFVKRVYGQGILYYVYLFCLHLVNLISLYRAPPNFLRAVTIPTRIFQTAFTTRLILHTRQGANKTIVMFSDSQNREYRLSIGQLAA